ncbi:MAG TPA: type IV pilus twitching motility protein PilT, partial [Candidatus Methylomirabilis sp.]|nr:type IV pilus twitching motility protein PilT [Candidatus Methylomirabilis sp.]
MNIDDLLRRAVESRASDLHLKVGNHPYLRVDGVLSGLTDVPRITPEEMLSMAFSMMTNRQKQKFKETAELDMAYGVAGLGRFRVNVFQQRGNVGMVLRVIPTKIRTIEELELPRILTQICEEQRGMVLCTGTTGSGKSTTLAGMIDRINSLRPEHIITIEDPIEYLHRDKKGFINQREVEVDTSSFSTALRAALRQDPDVILVGEMRDLETISTALLAAETGHLVLSTLHTLDATETIQRIIAVFPPPEQKQIRLQLASTLKAVVSQRLVRKSDGVGRVPAVEVLIATGYIRDCIINPDKTRLIRDALAAGTSQYGMQTFDQSIFDLYTRNLITLEEAMLRASNPDEF